jgi:phosphotransferase system HPr (HPr) family protein
VNARSVVSLLSLGATAGTCVRVLAEGDDAAAATAALSRALVQLLEAEALV